MYNGKRIAVCLIVRMKSSRLPKKAIADIHGRPAIEWLIDRLKFSKTVDEIVLCTSTNPNDAILIDIAEKNGIKGFQGDELDVLSRMIHVADTENADAVIRVTGDNILTPIEILDWEVRAHIESDADYTRVSGMPHGFCPEVMSRRMLNPLHDEVMPDPDKSEYMTLWAFDPEHFRCLVLEAPEDVNRPKYWITLDTPEDLALFRKLYDKLYAGEYSPTLRDTLHALDHMDKLEQPPDDTPVKLPDGNSISFGNFQKRNHERALKAREQLPIEGLEKLLKFDY